MQQPEQEEVETVIHRNMVGLMLLRTWWRRVFLFFDLAEVNAFLFEVRVTSRVGDGFACALAGEVLHRIVRRFPADPAQSGPGSPQPESERGSSHQD